MVDVSAKDVTVRRAVAAADIVLAAETAEMIRSGSADKGDVLAVARIAAIGATKWTQHLIPLCHCIGLDSVSVDFQWIENSTDAPDAQHTSTPGSPCRLRCVVAVANTGKTGVEMEAMTAASVGVLTVYDMVKSTDRSAVIGPIRLLSKSGGKSGDFVADNPVA
ncbi:Cyclic pyranopterin monophosphate synthase accessory protein [Stieleria varia]|uniref:cyclic pyranopterin monophosphate synthase n=2 Tax=Stieleria varia TaxID=2528005 RepID=A0A5C6AMK3_9BACT|nr:Cyclic pyranopterin monophosphate synthase accessory protein [Stieleria varia]